MNEAAQKLVDEAGTELVYLAGKARRQARMLHNAGVVSALAAVVVAAALKVGAWRAPGDDGNPLVWLGVISGLFSLPLLLVWLSESRGGEAARLDVDRLRLQRAILTDNATVLEGVISRQEHEARKLATLVCPDRGCPHCRAVAVQLEAARIISEVNTEGETE